MARGARRAFRACFSQEGDSLTRVPLGFAKDHLLADELKRKDFIGMVRLNEETVTSGNLRCQVTDRYRAAELHKKFVSCQPPQS
jgi:hypothetical protein